MQLWNVRKKNLGFTLTEVLVVGILFAILSAIAVPNLIGLLNNARVTDGTSDIEGAIKEAKRQAIRFSQTCVIEVATENIDGENRSVIRTAAAGTTASGNIISANNSRCLLERRILPIGVDVDITTNEASATPNMITISGKGNIDYSDLDSASATPPVLTERTYAVSHNSAATAKCVVLEGLFGDIQTGIVQDGNCNTNI